VSPAERTPIAEAASRLKAGDSRATAARDRPGERDQLARRSPVAAARRARHALGINTPQDLRWIIERLLKLGAEAEMRKQNVSEADARAAVLARWSSGLELTPDIADVVSDLHAVPQEL
jgi:hypothetical protein